MSASALKMMIAPHNLSAGSHVFTFRLRGLQTPQRLGDLNPALHVNHV